MAWPDLLGRGRWVALVSHRPVVLLHIYPEALSARGLSPPLRERHGRLPGATADFGHPVSGNEAGESDQRR
jgi:hypothetical protein